jgi:cytidylate kinase
MRSRITVAGDIGSGKTTLAGGMADKLGVELLSTGAVQRAIAKAKNMTVLELNRLADTDPAIDDEIDDYLRNLADETVVVESRLAWHFVKDTEKLYLYCFDGVAAARIFSADRLDEGYESEAESLKAVRERRKSEVARFKSRYGVNIADIRNYDLVIDTTYAPRSLVFEVADEYELGPNRPVCWLDYRNIVPTRGVTEFDASASEKHQAFIEANGWRYLDPIQAVSVDHIFYLVDGHARFAAAVRTGVPFMPVAVVGYNDEAFRDDMSARQYVSNAVRDSLVYQWEEELGFRYPIKLWRQEHR